MFSDVEKMYLSLSSWCEENGYEKDEAGFAAFASAVLEGKIDPSKSNTPEYQSILEYEAALQDHPTRVQDHVKKALKLWPENFDAFQEYQALKDASDLAYAKALAKKVKVVQADLKKRGILPGHLDLAHYPAAKSFLRLVYSTATSFEVVQDYEQSLVYARLAYRLDPKDELGARYLMANSYLYREMYGAFDSFIRKADFSGGMKVGYQLLRDILLDSPKSGHKHLLELKDTNIGIYWFLLSGDSEWLPTQIDNRGAYREGSMEETMLFLSNTGFLMEDTGIEGLVPEVNTSVLFDDPEVVFMGLLLFLSILGPRPYVTRKQFEDKGWGRGGKKDEIHGLFLRYPEFSGTWDCLLGQDIIEEVKEKEHGFALSPRGYQIGLICRDEMEREAEEENPRPRPAA